MRYYKLYPHNVQREQRGHELYNIKLVCFNHTKRSVVEQEEG